MERRLIVQKNASPHTITSYRDCWRLLLRFAQDRTGTPPARLSLEQLDAPMIGAFLDHLEHERGLSITSRNTRLAAVHSLFRFAAFRHPEHAALIGRVLAIPAKRGERALVCFLTPDEVDALLASPDRSRRTGRRDHALLLLAVQTGLRVSELTSLRIRDVALGSGAHVRCTGKGRKDRATPLTRQTAAVLRVYLAERGGEPEDPLFPGPAGSPLSTDAVRRLVERHAAGSARHCPSLGAKHVSPHVLRHILSALCSCCDGRLRRASGPAACAVRLPLPRCRLSQNRVRRVSPHQGRPTATRVPPNTVSAERRHTCAMRMLECGIDIATIALWLGHESIRTTQTYLHAYMALKERALARTTPPGTTPGRYKPQDSLLDFLEAL